MNVFWNMPIVPAARVKGLKQNTCRIKHTDEQMYGQSGRHTLIKLSCRFIQDEIKYYNNEPWHGISNNLVCAISKASNQPAHMRSLIRAFASRLNIL